MKAGAALAWTHCDLQSRHGCARHCQMQTTSQRELKHTANIQSFGKQFTELQLTLSSEADSITATV
jgi:hypothetical protein